MTALATSPRLVCSALLVMGTESTGMLHKDVERQETDVMAREATLSDRIDIWKCFLTAVDSSSYVYLVNREHKETYCYASFDTRFVKRTDPQLFKRAHDQR